MMRKGRMLSLGLTLGPVVVALVAAAAHADKDNHGHPRGTPAHGHPKAPVHILIIPKRHISSIAELEPHDADVIGRCFSAARKLGEAKGFAEKGYRISVNTGPEGGQLVYHVHFHFTAGRARGHGA